ncbi:hypothetical protein BJY01DRAFT_246937 [Aspergillus pseudoustus]|uniref:Uncharacterized protein n=1 Tax=Aspergillus pseudoustus TaxID=1810923 RepID=A0ABR4K4B5_9EURO
MRDGAVVDASAVARDWELFKAGVPSTYNSPYGFTYSPRNQTVFPDEYLRTWRMTFVISHPVILFPRIYGTLCLAKMPAHKTRLLCGLYMTYRWLRGLYDWCQQQDGSGSQQLAPIIIEGEELRYRPLPVIPDYCATTGLPVDYHRVLINSLLVENDKNSAFDQALANAVKSLTEGGKSSLDAWIEVGKCRWVVDYGQEAADMLEDFARAAEEDFVYLYANRMRMAPTTRSNTKTKSKTGADAGASSVGTSAVTFAATPTGHPTPSHPDTAVAAANVGCADTPDVAKRILIIALEPAEFTLLFAILNLERRPNIISNNQLFGGSCSFLAVRIINTPMGQWTAIDTQCHQGGLRQEIDNTEICTTRARAEGKAFCAYSCATWPINPVVLSRKPTPLASAVLRWEAFKAAVPMTYSDPRAGLTYTQWNQTVLPDHASFSLLGGLFTTLSHIRSMYAWAEASENAAAVAPIIVNPGDLAVEGAQIVQKLYEALGLGLDPDDISNGQLRELREKERLINQIRTDDINNVMAHGTSFLDSCSQVAKPDWVREFREYVPIEIERLAREAAPDYQYLSARPTRM